MVSALRRNFYNIESRANDVTEIACEALSHYTDYLLSSPCTSRGLLDYKKYIIMQ